MDCCGANNAYDYVGRNYSVPNECCLTGHRTTRFRHLRTALKAFTCHAEYVTKDGCSKVFIRNLEYEKWVILIFLYGGAVIKLAALAAAFIIPFEEIVEPIGWSPVGSLMKMPTEDQESENFANDQQDKRL